MVRVTVEAVAGLVADLYEGAYDDSKWAQALDALRRPFDSPSIVFSVENEIDRSSEIVSVNTDPYWDRLYVEEFFEHNVLWRPMAAMAPGTVAADWSLLPREEFRKTYIFNEFLAHLDSNSMLCCKILGRGSTSSFLALAHGVRQPEFDTDHIELMTALMPTLIRVTTLRDRIGALNLPTHTAAAALDALSVGIAVVGHNGRVIHANQSAQGLLAQRDGTVTVGPMGLTARVPEAATALRHLINQTVSGASEQDNGYLLLPSPQPTGPALSVYVGPLPEPGIYGLPDGPCAIVFMRPMETDANLE
ncbi:MAG TPA: hypothetical protein VJR58_21850, partial [Vineibacter sp.]|nr:hypothetical protein [Vineibacter sp.]